MASVSGITLFAILLSCIAATHGSDFWWAYVNNDGTTNNCNVSLGTWAGSYEVQYIAPSPPFPSHVACQGNSRINAVTSDGKNMYTSVGSTASGTTYTWIGMYDLTTFSWSAPIPITDAYIAWSTSSDQMFVAGLSQSVAGGFDVAIVDPQSGQILTYLYINEKIVLPSPGARTLFYPTFDFVDQTLYLGISNADDEDDFETMAIMDISGNGDGYTIINVTCPNCPNGDLTRMSLYTFDGDLWVNIRVDTKTESTFILANLDDTTGIATPVNTYSVDAIPKKPTLPIQVDWWTVMDNSINAFVQTAVNTTSQQGCMWTFDYESGKTIGYNEFDLFPQGNSMTNPMAFVNSI